MVVEEVRQVVGHQILSGDPEVDGVPILELLPHGVQFFFRDAALSGKRRFLEEDVVPDLVRHLLGADLEQVVGPVAAEGVALQEVGDGVVGHVDRGVGEGFDEPLFVPGRIGVFLLKCPTALSDKQCMIEHQ